jgi:hypothetical protein
MALAQLAPAVVVDRMAADRKDFFKLRVRNGIAKRRREVAQLKNDLTTALNDDHQYLLRDLDKAKTGADVEAALRCHRKLLKYRLKQSKRTLRELSSVQTRSSPPPPPRAKQTNNVNGPTDQ